MLGEAVGYSTQFWARGRPKGEERGGNAPRMEKECTRGWTLGGGVRGTQNVKVVAYTIQLFNFTLPLQFLTPLHP